MNSCWTCFVELCLGSNKNILQYEHRSPTHGCLSVRLNVSITVSLNNLEHVDSSKTALLWFKQTVQA